MYEIIIIITITITIIIITIIKPTHDLLLSPKYLNMARRYLRNGTLVAASVFRPLTCPKNKNLQLSSSPSVHLLSIFVVANTSKLLKLSESSSYLNKCFKKTQHTFAEILLHVTFVSCNQGGNSSKSDNTASFNSKLFSSPSPFKNFRLIEFGSRFFANLNGTETQQIFT